jgi:YVTN family beta-propeller protein
VLARAAALGPVLVCGPALLTAQRPAPTSPAASHHPDTAHAGHAGHAAPAATPAPAQPSAFGGAQARLASRRVGRAEAVAEQSGVRVAFAASAVGGGPVVAGREATLGVALAHAGSGAPFGGLEIAAWIDRREAPGSTPADACKAKVDKFVQAGITMEGALRAKPVEDLNSYLIVTLNRTAELAVLDPFLGFGRTKLRTTVPLKSPGVDWAQSPDGRRLYVSMPGAGAIAVVDAATWQVIANVPVSGRPGRVALSPDGGRLWVLPEAGTGPTGAATAMRDTVTVLDAAALRVAARVPVGTGARSIVFDAGDLAYVANEGSGTVSVIDARVLSRTADVPVGGRPASIAYSAAARAAYVLSGGSLVIVDGAKGAEVGRIAVAPGARAVRAAPAAGSGHSHGKQATDTAHAAHAAAADTTHAAHAGHAAGAAQSSAASAASQAGQWLFVTDPAARAVHIVDATTRRLFRTVQYEHTPDQVAFTGAFAYVRFGDSPQVSMISLDDPSTGGLGTMDVFETGRDAPRDASGELAASIAPAPDMPDAIYALNASERMIYYFHYMEGMPIPSGGLTTYQFEPRAVMAVGKAMREREPGSFSANTRITDAGEYDLVMLVGSPRVVQCFPFSVTDDASRAATRPALVLRALDSTRTLRIGGDTLRFQLADRKAGGKPVTAPDVLMSLVSTSGWRQNVRARLTEGETYVVVLEAPSVGAYFLSFAVPSLGIAYNHVPTTIVQAVDRGGR